MEDDDGSGGSVDFFRAEKWDGVVAISTSGGTDKGAGPEGGDGGGSDSVGHERAQRSDYTQRWRTGMYAQ
jgi:hypothetical protein